MEESTLTEASITFDAARADRRPVKGSGTVALQRYAFVFPRAARTRQGFGELLPKIARVRVSARALLVVLGIICVQRAEMRGFTPFYQDIFAIANPSLPCASPRTRTRAFFGSKWG